VNQADAFDNILRRLDVTFRSGLDDEKPARMKELVSKFCRSKKDTPRDYIWRFDNLIARLQEVRMVLPDDLVGY
jgi:hypothetical protein